MTTRIEKVILTSLLKDESFTNSTIPFLTSEYFHDRSERIVFDVVVSYVNKYKTSPTKDALLIEKSGCFSLVLEKIPNILSKKVSNKLKIPIIGIGAGSSLDGQVLVSHDMLGMNKDFSPRFLRRYLDLDSLITNAVKKYSKDIKNGDFPNKEEQY